MFESNSSQVGDAADTFDTIKGGHTEYYQAEVAARNILQLIHRDEKGGIIATDLDSELEEYMPGPPAIKVSLGMIKSLSLMILEKLTSKSEDISYPDIIVRTTCGSEDPFGADVCWRDSKSSRFSKKELLEHSTPANPEA
ncbi:hypothetical protein EDD22DRAFT_854752 [Suillus occidentalis]|nr:hypothetical protein EDD22DRAFT_854752 [Suillus occidentalis]